MADNIDIVKGLAGLLDRDRIMTDPGDVAGYAVDGLEPAAVVFPSNTQEVAEVMKFACAEKLAVVPRGSGTKMGMGLPPARLDLVLCTARMNHMKDVDSANLTITAEAGVRFRDIQARLATEEDRCYLPLSDLGVEEDDMICSERSHSGTFLPLDPPLCEKATLGGIIAADTTGPRRLLYGLPRDRVLGVRFVTPEGEIVGAGGKTVKNVSGYDISKLMVGSMGSLGVICDITCRLLPLPEKMETLFVRFTDLDRAMDLADRISRTKLIPAALEIMNGAAFQAAAAHGPNVEQEDFVLAMALESFHEAVERMKRETLAMADDMKALSTGLANEDEHRRFWLGVSELGRQRNGQKLVTVKVHVPLSRWKIITALAAKTLKGTPYRMLSHAGSGVCLLHMEPADSKAASSVLEILFRACLQAEGNLTVLHAPAAWKKDLPVWGEPGSHMKVMENIKRELDPSGIMSPGRFAGGL